MVLNSLKINNLIERLELGLNEIFGSFGILRDVLGYTLEYIVIRMDVRIERISRIRTDFFYFFA
jgi:hypothetical protein